MALSEPAGEEAAAGRHEGDVPADEGSCASVNWSHAVGTMLVKR